MTGSEFALCIYEEIYSAGPLFGKVRCLRTIYPGPVAAAQEKVRILLLASCIVGYNPTEFGVVESMKSTLILYDFSSAHRRFSKRPNFDYRGLCLLMGGMLYS